MPRLKERDYTYFTTVRGMCRRCRSVGPSRVYFRDGQVWQESLCPCGPQEPALIASDSGWYLSEVVRAMPDHSPLTGAKSPRLGCPHDCGPCTWHASPCQLPVLSITNACNLRCPICFTYNRDDRIYHMSVAEMRHTVDWIVESSGQVDLINITGGEPTLHPQLLELLDVCRRPEIGRITMNSNGIRLADDIELCRQLADRGVYVILSFNTFDADVSRRLHGVDLTAVKRRAIENLASAGVRMTLLNVLLRGVNEDAIGGIFGLMRQYENILSLTVQTMTYTGQGGGKVDRGTGPFLGGKARVAEKTPAEDMDLPPSARHIPVDEATRIICREANGILQFDDFTSRPAAHPLCYRIAYMLKTGEDFLPFARFASKEQIEPLLADSYLIRASDGDDFFRDAVNQLYAEGRTEHLATLRRLVERLYPAGEKLDDSARQRIAESSVRTVYVHAHMDEDTFDCSRAMLCPDLVPAEPGRLIPACTYNLFYRMKDERFYLDGGRMAGGDV